MSGYKLMKDKVINVTSLLAPDWFKTKNLTSYSISKLFSLFALKLLEDIPNRKVIHFLEPGYYDMGSFYEVLRCENFTEVDVFIGLSPC